MLESKARMVVLAQSKQNAVKLCSENLHTKATRRIRPRTTTSQGNSSVNHGIPVINNLWLSKADGLDMHLPVSIVSKSLLVFCGQHTTQ